MCLHTIEHGDVQRKSLTPWKVCKIAVGTAGDVKKVLALSRSEGLLESQVCVEGVKNIVHLKIVPKVSVLVCQCFCTRPV